MSSLWKKCTYSQRQLGNQWMNLIYGSHDMWCHCEDVILHLLTIINSNSQFKKPEPEIANIKCLLTGPDRTATASAEEDTGIDQGDLERLFADDTTPEDNAG